MFLKNISATLVKVLHSETKVIHVDLPKNDLSEWSTMTKHIFLADLSNDKSHINQEVSNLYTCQGQHFNFKEKTWLAEIIAEKVEVKNQAVLNQIGEEPSPPGTGLISGNLSHLPKGLIPSDIGNRDKIMRLFLNLDYVILVVGELTVEFS